jgi:hypothetical protein
MLIWLQRLTLQSGFRGIKEMAVLPRRFPNPPAPVSERRKSAGLSAAKTDVPVPASTPMPALNG